MSDVDHESYGSRKYRYATDSHLLIDGRIRVRPGRGAGPVDRGGRDVGGAAYVSPRVDVRPALGLPQPHGTERPVARRSTHRSARLLSRDADPRSRMRHRAVLHLPGARVRRAGLGDRPLGAPVRQLATHLRSGRRRPRASRSTPKRMRCRSRTASSTRSSASTRTTTSEPTYGSSPTSRASRVGARRSGSSSPVTRSTTRGSPPIWLRSPAIGVATSSPSAVPHGGAGSGSRAAWSTSPTPTCCATAGRPGTSGCRRARPGPDTMIPTRTATLPCSPPSPGGRSASRVSPAESSAEVAWWR